MSQCVSLQVQRKEMPSLSPGKKKLMHQYLVIAGWLEINFAEDDLGILEDTKTNISQQCALAAKKTYSFLGFIRQSTECR